MRMCDSTCCLSPRHVTPDWRCYRIVILNALRDAYWQHATDHGDLAHVGEVAVA